MENHSPEPSREAAPHSLGWLCASDTPPYGVPGSITSGNSIQSLLTLLIGNILEWDSRYCDIGKITDIISHICSDGLITYGWTLYKYMYLYMHISVCFHKFHYLITLWTLLVLVFATIHAQRMFMFPGLTFLS